MTDATLADVVFADLEIHAEPAREFAAVYPNADGTVTFEATEGDGRIESDTVCEVVR